jgi:hypothetical protein
LIADRITLTLRPANGFLGFWSKLSGKSQEDTTANSHVMATVMISADVTPAAEHSIWEFGVSLA